MEITALFPVSTVDESLSKLHHHYVVICNIIKIKEKAVT